MNFKLSKKISFVLKGDFIHETIRSFSKVPLYIMGSMHGNVLHEVKNIR